MAGGGCTGGEGGCTCILCIPPGYAPEVGNTKVKFMLRILEKILVGSETGSGSKKSFRIHNTVGSLLVIDYLEILNFFLEFR
jgi:hypothetical protein